MDWVDKPAGGIMMWANEWANERANEWANERDNEWASR